MQQTKADLLEQCNSLSQENSRVWETLIAMNKGEDLLVGKFTADNWHVTIRLINPTRAHGGILFIYSKGDEKHNSFSSSYLEEEHRYFQWAYLNGEYGYQMRELIGKAMAMRNKALEAINVAA